MARPGSVPGGGGIASPNTSGNGSSDLAAMRALATVINGGNAPSRSLFTKGYVAAIDNNTPTQTVSIYIDGDTTSLISGVAFADSYHNPMVGDVVIVVHQGADVFILDRYTQGGGLLAHALLSSDSAISVNLPASNYDHLRVYIVGESSASTANGFDDISVQFNGDSSADYSRHLATAVNNATWVVVNASVISYITGGFVQASNVSPGVGGGYAVIEIPFYQRTSLSKQLVFNSHASSGVGSPNNFQFGHGGGIWGNSTGAITSLQIGCVTSPGTFKSGTEVYVYGV